MVINGSGDVSEVYDFCLFYGDYNPSGILTSTEYGNVTTFSDTTTRVTPFTIQAVIEMKARVSGNTTPSTITIGIRNPNTAGTSFDAFVCNYIIESI